MLIVERKPNTGIIKFSCLKIFFSVHIFPPFLYSVLARLFVCLLVSRVSFEIFFLFVHDLFLQPKIPLSIFEPKWSGSLTSVFWRSL